MGIATGVLPQGTTAASSAVMALAKLVSDAGNGGQVLMCGNTFKAVKDMGRELGCVTHNGPQADSPGWRLWM